MSLNISVGYGAAYVTTHPEFIVVGEKDNRVVIDSNNASRSESVSLFLTKQQAATLLTMLQSLLGKAT